MNYPNTKDLITIYLINIIGVILLNIYGVQSLLALLVFQLIVFPVLIFSLPYFCIVRKYKLPFCKTIGLKNQNLKQYIESAKYGFIGLVVLSGTDMVIFGILHYLQVSPINQTPLIYLPLPTLVIASQIISAVVMAPILEEILFRGFIQSILTRKLGNYSAILITATLFMLIHLRYYGNLYALSSVFTVGLITGYLKYRTKSLQAGMFTHFFLNLLSVL